MKIMWEDFVYVKPLQQKDCYAKLWSRNFESNGLKITRTKMNIKSASLVVLTSENREGCSELVIQNWKQFYIIV